jgi:hypothetical protein
VDYCIEQREPKQYLCGDELANVAADMDLGIYEYDAIGFRMDYSGVYRPEVRGGLGLVGQANRLEAGDLYGDGHTDFLSPFDRGIANGWFRNNGELGECPQGYGCGMRVSSPQHVSRPDRRDAVLDTMAAIRGRNIAFRWHYYPLSNPRRALYSVPSLDSPDRYLGRDRYYFRSSMYVPGEMEERTAEARRTSRYQYGNAVYNTQGRGMAGFQWLSVDDDRSNFKSTYWFRQQFPFWGMQEHAWVEADTDRENDYLHASPGRSFVSEASLRLECYGPPDHPASREFGCQPSGTPTFWIKGTELKKDRP